MSVGFEYLLHKNNAKQVNDYMIGDKKPTIPVHADRFSWVQDSLPICGEKNVIKTAMARKTLEESSAEKTSFKPPLLSSQDIFLRRNTLHCE